MNCFWKKTILPLLAFSLLALNAAPPRYLRVTGVQQAKRQILTDVPTLRSGKITLVSPAPGAVVPTLNAKHKAYLKIPREERIKLFASHEYRQKMCKAGYYQQPVKLQWNCGNASGHAHQVIISESPKFTDAVVFTVKTNELSLDNFKIAQKYYWRVAGPNGEASPAGEFTTEAIAPRLIRIESVWNARDLGGRIGRDGRRVKQGLIYRSGGLNRNTSRKKVKPEIAFKDKPELMKQYQAYVKTAADCQKQIDNNFNAAYLAKPLVGRNWIVYCPKGTLTREQVREFASVQSIPARIAGAEAHPVSADKNHKIIFPTKKGGWAFYIQEFDSDSQGVIQVEVGADCNSSVMLNGKVLLDALVKGNGKQDFYTIDAPVRKGKNLIVAAVSSGAKSWIFYFRQVEKPKTRHALKDKIKFNLAAAADMLPFASNTPGKTLLTAETKRYVTLDLGWKSDIDLRSDGECRCMTGSPAGPSVKWCHSPLNPYGSMYTREGREKFRDTFKIFLNPDNYPIEFHCIGGQDRTGSLAFVLNALLGVSEEELFLDWEVTGFWNPKENFNHSRIKGLITAISRSPGNTIQEKVENYVLESGFTRNDINLFREFMLEK